MCAINCGLLDRILGIIVPVLLILRQRLIQIPMDVPIEGIHSISHHLPTDGKDSFLHILSTFYCFPICFHLLPVFLFGFPASGWLLLLFTVIYELIFSIPKKSEILRAFPLITVDFSSMFPRLFHPASLQGASRTLCPGTLAVRVPFF